MSLPIKVLSVVLAGYFIFIGVTKVTDKVNDYKKFVLNIRNPIKQHTGYLIKSKYLRRGIGGAEILFGFFMLPLFPILLATVGLIILMHISLQRGIEYLAAPIVFALLLLARLIMVYQTKTIKHTYQPPKNYTQYDKKEKLSDNESEETEQSDLDEGGDQMDD